LLALAIAGIAILLRKPILQVNGLILGAAVMCFLGLPLSRLFERRLTRSMAALASLISIGLICALLIVLLLPVMLRELIDLAQTLPQSMSRLAVWTGQVQGWLEHYLPGIALPAFDLNSLGGSLSSLAIGAIAAISSFVDAIGSLSMQAVLAYFFLCDRERLLLRLELLLPRSIRHTAVHMGNAVLRELRLYLKAQLMISGAVSLLAVLALLLTGVRSALVLGPLIGILNMIPYFGPFIGGIPAVLIALGDGWQKAALTVLSLTVVQQLDGSLISPRIMGSLTGFSPALVLVGIYAGAAFGGFVGMLCALPVMMTIRTLFRVFVQKYENI